MLTCDKTQTILVLTSTGIREFRFERTPIFSTPEAALEYLKDKLPGEVGRILPNWGPRGIWRDFGYRDGGSLYKTKIEALGYAFELREQSPLMISENIT